LGTIRIVALNDTPNAGLELQSLNQRRDVYLIRPLKGRFMMGEYPSLIAINPAKPQKKIAQQVGYSNSWWPGAESTKV
jgi:hypothetical protein